MASLLTNLRANQLNSLRTTQGIPGSLSLHSVSATGYTEIATIESGWFAQRETDQIDGTQFLAARIVETDINLELLTAAAQTVAAIAFNGFRYKCNSTIAPLEEPRVWMLRCEPTGEAV